jgi:predicted nucleic acid-binding protein
VKTRVFDSWPIIEWLDRKEPATQMVRSLLLDAQDGSIRLLMSAINVGEVYYFVSKNRSESVGELWRSLCRTLPVTFEVPSGEEIWKAAFLKGRHPISYADAFAAGLAQKYGCPLITGDPEFRSVENLELDWIDRLI